MLFLVETRAVVVSKLCTSNGDFVFLSLGLLLLFSVKCECGALGYEALLFAFIFLFLFCVAGSQRALYHNWCLCQISGKVMRLPRNQKHGRQCLISKSYVVGGGSCYSGSMRVAAFWSW